MSQDRRSIVRKDQMPVLIVHLIALPAFTLLFLSRQNYEFLLYIGVIVVFLALIVTTNRRVAYPTGLLWGLTAWALLHMGGGGIFLSGERLYGITLIPISARYNIFRYDQFVHIVGFGVATAVMYHLLLPSLAAAPRRWVSLSIVVVMAGLGVGALNEIIEFAATVIMPETGVGGYVNTSLDLVSDLVGALGALVWIRLGAKSSDGSGDMSGSMESS
jgi:putative membrane protein